jgi:hypothetical protein
MPRCNRVTAARFGQGRMPGRKSKFFGTKSKPDGTNSKAGGTKSKSKSLNFLRRISHFQGLAPTPTPRGFCSSQGVIARRLKADAAIQGTPEPHDLLDRHAAIAHRERGVSRRPIAARDDGAVFAPVSSSALPVFRFRSSGLFKQGKGWRRFMIADARASFARLVGRGADEREKETRRPRSKAPGLAEKDRPIDPTSGKNSPASPSPIRRRANGQADGRQPSCLRVSHDRCLRALSLPFRP